MFDLGALRRSVLGTVAATVAVGSVLASSAGAFAGESEMRASDFSQVAAAPVQNNGSIDGLVTTVGAPLVNVNIPCPAPWQQGGVAGSDYNACNNAPVYQQGAMVGGDLGGDGSSARNDGFGQTAAAPVENNGSINGLVTTVGAPLVNVNIPCPAPWNQGGVAGADYNACNNAPVFQQDAPVAGDLVGTERTWADQPTGFGQTAAAPVENNGSINGLVTTAGAPLVNVNVPCPAPWQQGGLFGSDYNACSNAPVYQQDAVVKGSLIGR
jgi:hypothetical protein